ncbi:5-formyltetrahydrofolate cyclo-ligase [Thermovibrio sp.]
MKERIRQELLSKRLLLTKDQISSKSLKIAESLKELLRKGEFTSFLFFYPIKGEPDLLGLAELFLEEGKVVAFPKVVGKEIYPVKVSSLRELSPGKFGIKEPPYTPENFLREIEVVITPGVAFDREGYRLGYGGGFYDRFFCRFPVKLKVGVCYSFQLLNSLPREPFDVPVDLVITEKERIRRKRWSQF